MARCRAPEVVKRTEPTGVPVRSATDQTESVSVKMTLRVWLASSRYQNASDG